MHILMTGKIGHGHRPSAASETPTHRFDVGQAVYLRDGFGRNNLSSDKFHITGKLPTKDGLPQYRIRGEKEAYERMVTQDRLEAVDAQGSDPNQSLIDKTFG